ncbi:MAG: hypothetical protein ACNA78_00330 [Balneolaceae bacterium]
MSVNHAQKETFVKLLEQIKMQVSLLRKQNRDLKLENRKLTAKLEQLQKNKSDIFSEITEAERMAMKHRVEDMIEKINKHVD